MDSGGSLGEDDGRVVGLEKLFESAICAVAETLSVKEYESRLQSLSRPIRLRFSQKRGKKCKDQFRRKLVSEDGIAIRPKLLLAAQFAYGIPPVSCSQLAQIQNGAIGSPAGLVHVDQPGDIDQDGRIVGGEERCGRKYRGDPAQLEPLRHQRSGEIQFPGDHQVRAGSGLKSVLKRLAQMRKNQLPKKDLWPTLQIFALSDHFPVGRIEIRTYGMESYSETLDFLPVVPGCSNRRPMPAAHEFQCKRDAGMKVAKRTDGCEQDSLRLSSVYRIRHAFRGLSLSDSEATTRSG
jgi:hypothetical protein